MPRYKSLPKAKRKKPDEFVSTVDHAVRYIARYKGVFLIAVVAAALIGVGILILNQKRESDLASLNQMIFEANQSSENKVESLQSVIQKYKRYPLVEAARLSLADYYLNKGEPAESLKQISLAAHNGPEAIAPVLRFSEGQLFWQQGELEKALKSVDVPAGQAGEKMSGYLSFLKGEILESIGKKDEALLLYRQLAESQGEDNLLRKRAQARLAWLLASN